MFKAPLFFMVGIVLGAAATWGMHGGEIPTATPPNSQPLQQRCDDTELQRMRQRVTQLESDLASTAQVSNPTVPSAESTAPATQDDTALSWKVSAIEKFVPLTDEQRDRLREKYTKEGAGDNQNSESLDDILGAESAHYYRERVQATFKKVQEEEVEREVVWLARKLALSEVQERSVQQILVNVEAEVTKGITHGGPRTTPQERVRAMIAENRLRSQLLNEQLRQVLTPDQLQAYLRMEADSPAADVEVFHDPGQASETPKP